MHLVGLYTYCSEIYVLTTFFLSFFLYVAQQRKSAVSRDIVGFSRPCPIRHTAGRIPNEWWTCRRDRYLHKTQQTLETNSHAVSRIRTYNPSDLAAADVSLRPHGRRHRHVFICNTLLSLCTCITQITNLDYRSETLFWAQEPELLCVLFK